mgnify:FL=1
MNVKGKITKILDTKTGTSKAGKEWKKTSFLLETDEEYNNLYCFDILGVEKVDKFLQWNSKGDTVKVDFDVVTKEWKGSYYTALNAWKVFRDDNASVETEEMAEEGDLPF